MEFRSKKAFYNKNYSSYNPKDYDRLMDYDNKELYNKIRQLEDIINEKEMLATISNKENVHHIRDVMRMKKGDNIILLDNSGYEYLCDIVEISNKVALKILNKKERRHQAHPL